MSGWRRPRAAAVTMLALVALLGVPTPAYAEDVGYVDQSYTGVSAPTGEKPQSKLWIAGGTWWGTLWDTASQDYHIFRFDPGAQSWTDTGVLVDERSTSSPDAYWDGTRLYVVSAGRSEATSSQAPRIYRFSFNAATQTWARDSGFPVTIGNGGTEAVTLAKLNHPNIATLYSFMRQGDSFIMVLEFVRGVTRDGEIYDFARTTSNETEFCGGCFSPDGDKFGTGKIEIGRHDKQRFAFRGEDPFANGGVAK